MSTHWRQFCIHADPFISIELLNYYLAQAITTDLQGSLKQFQFVGIRAKIIQN